MSRKGLTLTEAVVAMFLIAAPMASLMDLSRGNARGAAADVERFAEEQLLADTLETLTLDAPRTLLRVTRDPAALIGLLERRASAYHEAAQPAAARAIEALRGHLSCRVMRGVAGHPELVRIQLCKNASVIRARLCRVKRPAIAEALGNRRD